MNGKVKNVLKYSLSLLAAGALLYFSFKGISWHDFGIALKACRWEWVVASMLVGGVVLYLSLPVVHAQYSSATPEGKSLGAIDAIYERIMHHDYKDWPYFDFGRSTENPDGSGLNEALVFQKEGFGARGLCYDIYEWDL